MVDGCVLCMALMKGATMAFGRNEKGAWLLLWLGYTPWSLLLAFDACGL